MLGCCPLIFHANKFTTKVQHVHVIVSGHQKGLETRNSQTQFSVLLNNTWCTSCHSNIMHVATTSSIEIPCNCTNQ